MLTKVTDKNRFEEFSTFDLFEKTGYDNEDSQHARKQVY